MEVNDSQDNNKDVMIVDAKEQEINYKENKNMDVARDPNENKNDFIDPTKDLNKMKTPFTIDIIKLAGECFDLFLTDVKKNVFNKIDIYEVINLLDVIGIKKNEFEVKNKILELKSENPKKFSSDEKYSKENFCDVVEAFKNYRIEEKLLVACFRKIDKEEEGTVDFIDIQRTSKERGLNFSDEEIYEMLDFFGMDDKLKPDMSLENYYKQNKNELPYLNFENFCKLYYQG